jgi:putative SOS response-associated peptidase YedK
MCGRFVRKSSAEEIAEEFSVDLSDISFLLEPSYNTAPGKEVAAVMAGPKRVIEGLKWGLIPPWATDEKSGYRMINARAETISQKINYKNAFRQRRCLLVADGFYEWSGEGRVKRPYYFRMKEGHPFGLAGLFEIWQNQEGKKIKSCAVITTSANKLMLPIHDRMPAIIRREDYFKWLDNNIFDEKSLNAMLKPFDSVAMLSYPVNLLVNSPKNDSPACIEPVRSEL